MPEDDKRVYSEQEAAERRAAIYAGEAAFRDHFGDERSVLIALVAALLNPAIDRPKDIQEAVKVAGEIFKAARAFTRQEMKKGS